MPLPQQVINQLSQDRPKTPGWSSGIIFFSGGIFIVVLAIYFLLVAIYGPYLNSSLAATQGKVDTLDQSIASGDQAQLVAFYSQITNLQSLLQDHIVFSQFLTWLEQNTEANVSYSQLSFATGDQITITGIAPSESDVNEQAAIFEASPAVEKAVISNVAISGTQGLWTFSATLIMNPAIFTATATASTTPTTP